MLISVFAVVTGIWVMSLVLFAAGLFLVVTDFASRGWATVLGFVMMVGALVLVVFVSGGASA